MEGFIEAQRLFMRSCSLGEQTSNRLRVKSLDEEVYCVDGK
jgi:hypothetical protein